MKYSAWFLFILATGGAGYWLYSYAKGKEGQRKPSVYIPPPTPQAHASLPAEIVLHTPHSRDSESTEPSPPIHPCCEICLEPVSDQTLILIPECKHQCCSKCFTSYVSGAVGDRSKFPLRCFAECKSLVPENLIPKELLAKYGRWKLKASDREKIACPECKKRFVISDTAKHATCIHCQYIFCTHCKEKWHGEGKECPMKLLHQQTELVNEMKLLNMLEEKKWSQCPKCQEPIEKSDGCNHMQHVKCPRNRNQTTHFCYICNVQLLGSYYKYEMIEGKEVLHFPLGLYGECRSAKIAQDEKDRKSKELLFQLGLVEKKLNLNEGTFKFNDCRLFAVKKDGSRWSVWTYRVIGYAKRYEVNLYPYQTCTCDKFKASRQQKQCKHILAAKAICKQIMEKNKQR